MSQAVSNWWLRFRQGLRHAFALEGPHGAISAEDRNLLARLAEKVVARRMAAPAVLFLQSLTPLSAIGSQAMVFLRPFLTPLLNPADYDRLTRLLDRRDGLGALVDAIETAEADRRKPETRNSKSEGNPKHEIRNAEAAPRG